MRDSARKLADEARRLKQASLDRLLKRIGPKRYDATARTFRAWHRLRYPVVFSEKEGVDSFGLGKIVIYNAPKACPQNAATRSSIKPSSTSQTKTHRWGCARPLTYARLGPMLWT